LRKPHGGAGVVGGVRHAVSGAEFRRGWKGVVFVAGVTRTATRAARSDVDVTTGEVPRPRALVGRVGWLAALIAETGQQVLDARWTADEIRAIRAKESASGSWVPSFAYKAVAALWGWSKLPVGVYGVSRVTWMARELAGRQLRSAGHRRGVVERLLAGVMPRDAGDPVSGENRRRRISRYLDETGSSGSTPARPIRGTRPRGSPPAGPSSRPSPPDATPSRWRT
jgi:hypothetical protein